LAGTPVSSAGGTKKGSAGTQKSSAGANFSPASPPKKNNTDIEHPNVAP